MPKQKLKIKKHVASKGANSYHNNCIQHGSNGVIREALNAEYLRNAQQTSGIIEDFNFLISGVIKRWL